MRAISVREAARLMNVSERLVYDCRRLERTGRQDLVDAVVRGEMSVTAALIAAGARQRRSPTWARLVAAWNAAADEERQRLLQICSADEEAA